jgi:hypothetical protein
VEPSPQSRRTFRTGHGKAAARTDLQPLDVSAAVLRPSNKGTVVIPR